MTKILTLHPEGKRGVNIDRAKYDEMERALLRVIGRSAQGVPFGELAERRVRVVVLRDRQARPRGARRARARARRASPARAARALIAFDRARAGYPRAPVR